MLFYFNILLLCFCFCCFYGVFVVLSVFFIGFLVNSHSNSPDNDMENENPDIDGNNSNDDEQDNNNNSNGNNDQSDEDDNDNDDNDGDEDGNGKNASEDGSENDNDDENDGESREKEFSIDLYEMFDFPECIKNDKTFFDKNGEYLYDSDELKKYSDNGMTRFKPRDSKIPYYKLPILDIVPAFRRLRLLLPKEHRVVGNVYYVYCCYYIYYNRYNKPTDKERDAGYTQ